MIELGVLPKADDVDSVNHEPEPSAGPRLLAPRRAAPLVRAAAPATPVADVRPVLRRRGGVAAADYATDLFGRRVPSPRTAPDLLVSHPQSS